MTFLPGLLNWDPRSERLIAFLRLALAAGSLAVIWLDPTQPSKHWPVAYGAFTLYVLYSAVVSQMVRGRPRPWLPLTTQAIDLLWVVPVVYFTEGANTPFFPFFVVFTLTAGIRWGPWASWAVSLYSLIVYGGLLFVETPTPLNLNNDLMRLGYFLIVGYLGGYLAEYRRRRETEMKTMQAAAEVVGTRHEALGALAALITYARSTALADVAIGILREPGEGDVMMVRGASDIVRLSEEEAAPFFSAAQSGPPLAKGSPTIRLTDSAAVILRFAEAERGLAYPIRSGADLVGAMFFFARGRRARRHPSDSFLSLLLRHVMPQLENLYTLERARYVQVLEERRRIARDLHDSFIQVLAALGLRLDVLCATPATEPGAERLQRELLHMREVIGCELKRVRAYLAEMREPLDDLGTLSDLVGRTAEAFQSRTLIPVRAAVEDGAADVPPEIVRELAPLLREALTNVEKHARASQVEVSARREADRLLLTVRDDGVGISGVSPSVPNPVPGHGHGLFSMRERAQLLGGTLSLGRLDSGGTLVQVSIPLAARGKA